VSNVNITRAVENIRSGTNVYTPLIEVTVNAIQAIEATARTDGLVIIEINRSPQRPLDESKSEIIGFSITDNGEGFTTENREAFDTLYTAKKIKEGGKGFGRFTCLKYFSDIAIESIFQEEGVFKKRTFKMGKDTEIIVNETVSECLGNDTRSVVTLTYPKLPIPEKSVSSLARTLVEKLLPYFLSETQSCPRIILKESEESFTVVLNDYLANEKNPLIQEIASARGDFNLCARGEEQCFNARVFKIYSPKTTHSKISLVAHRREVTATSIHNYIPEFSEEFCDKLSSDPDSEERNFIIKVYVFGRYLNESVSLERGGFEFHKEQDLIYGISQREIELQASVFARKAVDSDVSERRERKIERINSYVNEEAPWHSSLLSEIDFSDFPCNPTNEQIEDRLHHQKYTQDLQVKEDVKALLSSNKPDEMMQITAEIVSRVSGSSRNDLVRYVSMRKSVLDIFEKSLSLGHDGKYSSEGLVHDIIFPRKKDSDTAAFDEHNLWIVDERLSFTEYLSSDIHLDGGRSGRPDLLAFDKRIGFRGDNEASNPVTIFEFKKPQRDDFVDPSSKEDPVQQIIRYVIKIKDGGVRTLRGREILVADNTPFYGYVVCDLTQKVRNWLESEKNFKPMPDRLGYFFWHENLNLYIEVLGWDKVLRDANMRNKIFFHHLGIDTPSRNTGSVAHSATST
jgi:hypothetical protein